MDGDFFKFTKKSNHHTNFTTISPTVGNRHSVHIASIKKETSINGSPSCGQIASEPDQSSQLLCLPTNVVIIVFANVVFREPSRSWAFARRPPAQLDDANLLLPVRCCWVDIDIHTYLAQIERKTTRSTTVDWMKNVTAEITSTSDFRTRAGSVVWGIGDNLMWRKMSYEIMYLHFRKLPKI